ncbi:hypothetical protein [Nostoc sp. CALU 1950]|uniref:hypothetical protein n=1 Tax=Nostoc sp. CALU 1950 TaxID=3104321 RepID=UPI003EBDC1F1
MAITSEKTLLNNQSILEKITLVEEIDEQAAEIISGGQSVNVLNKEMSTFEGSPPKVGEDKENDEEKDDETLSSGSAQQANFAFVQDRSWRTSNRSINRYC